MKLLYILIFIFIYIINVNKYIFATHSFNIGGLFPIKNFGNIGIHRAAAALFAYDRIRNNSNLFNNKNFTYSHFIINDTERNSLVASKLVYDQIIGAWNIYHEPSDHLIQTCDEGAKHLRSIATVGPALSSVSVATSLIGAIHGRMTVSYSATSPTLSNKNLYPYFCRVVPSDSNQAHVVVDIMKLYNWDNIGILSTSDEYGQGLPAAFMLLADQEDLTYTYRPFNHEDNNYRDAIRIALQDIKSERHRIILLHMVIIEAQIVFQIAYELGISPENGYVFIASDGWSNNNFFDHNDVAIKNLLSTNSYGIIGIAQEDHRDEFMNLFQNHAEKYESIFGVEAGTFNEINIYAPYAYDAVFAVTHVLNNLVNKGNDTQIGDNWFQEMRQLQFTGVTGLIKFNEFCDREPLYGIVNRRNINGVSKFLYVGSWSTENEEHFKVIPEIIFFDGSTLPPNDRIRPIVSLKESSKIWTTILVCLICIFFMLISWIVYKYRDDPQFRARSPNLIQIILWGSITALWSIVVTAFSNSSYTKCILPLLLLSIGVTSSFGTLLGRTYRIGKLFARKQKLTSSLQIMDSHIMICVLIATTYDILFFNIFYAIEPINVVLKAEMSDSSVDIEVCDWNTGQSIALIICEAIPKILLILSVSIISFKTRFVESNVFNESKTITMAIWSEMIVVLSSVTIIVAFRHHLTLSFYALVIGVCLGFFVLVIILLGQPLLNILNQVRHLSSAADTAGLNKKDILSSASSRRKFARNNLMCQNCGNPMVLPRGTSLTVNRRVSEYSDVRLPHKDRVEIKEISKIGTTSRVSSGSTARHNSLGEQSQIRTSSIELNAHNSSSQTFRSSSNSDKTKKHNGDENKISNHDDKKTQIYNENGKLNHDEDKKEENLNAVESNKPNRSVSDAMEQIAENLTVN